MHCIIQQQAMLERLTSAVVVTTLYWALQHNDLAGDRMLCNRQPRAPQNGLDACPHTGRDAGVMGNASAIQQDAGDQSLCCWPKRAIQQSQAGDVLWLTRHSPMLASLSW